FLHCSMSVLPLLCPLPPPLTHVCLSPSFFSFFFNDPATTEIYTLSLHDALPISQPPRELDGGGRHRQGRCPLDRAGRWRARDLRDRKSTRLNSSHVKISYAVFCLKKKKTQCNRKALRPQNGHPTTSHILRQLEVP